MVNTGTRSRGCQTCKIRKVKCDLTSPTCHKCEKAGRQCTGVLEASDVVFIDQSNSIKAKVVGFGTQTTSIQGSASPVSRWGTTTAYATDANGSHEVLQYSNKHRASSSPTPAHDLALHGESQAVALFFDNFVIYPTAAKFMNPYLECLTFMYPRCTSSDPLYHATVAVSTMILSFYDEFSEARSHAIKAYGKSLQSVGAAIKTPEALGSNSILMTILMLSMYEMLSTSDSSKRAYHKHITGAISLLRMRDPSQKTNKETSKLIQAIRGELIMSCICSGIRVDDASSPSAWFLPETFPTTDAREQLDNISISISNLIADANSLLSELSITTNPENFYQVLASAYANDQALLHWSLNVPAEYDYSTVAVFDPVVTTTDLETATVWPGLVHVYTDIFVAKTLNNYRIFRIYVQCIMIRCLTLLILSADTPSDLSIAQLLSDLRLARDRASHTLTILVDDICASVPFHMGLPPAVGPSYFGIRTQMTTAAMGGYFVIEPLFIASGITCASMEQRIWIKGRLRAISNTFGFGRARALSYDTPSMVVDTFSDNEMVTSTKHEDPELQKIMHSKSACFI